MPCIVKWWIFLGEKDFLLSGSQNPRRIQTSKKTSMSVLVHSLTTVIEISRKCHVNI